MKRKNNEVLSACVKAQMLGVTWLQRDESFAFGANIQITNKQGEQATADDVIRGMCEILNEATKPKGL